MKKKIYFLAVIVFSISMIHCKKSAIDPKQEQNNLIKDNIEEVIWGNWQLKEVGTGAYPTNSAANITVAWTLAKENLKYRFDDKGGYLQFTDDKLKCKGMYQIGKSDLVLTADCLIGTGRFGIHDYTKNDLILGDGVTIYRFKNLDRN